MFSLRRRVAHPFVLLICSARGAGPTRGGAAGRGRNGAGGRGGAAGASSKPKRAARPAKSAEDLDAEMEDYAKNADKPAAA